MLNSFPVSVIIGSVLGFLSGLGTGGGSLLILWLTLAVSMNPIAARTINLLFFIPSALIACIFRWRQGQIDLVKLMPAVIAGCISAAVFSWLSTIAEPSLFRKIFGILLVFTGIRELLYKK